MDDSFDMSCSGGHFFLCLGFVLLEHEKEEEHDRGRGEDDEEKVDLHQPFLYNVPDEQVLYRCTKCSAQAMNLAEEYFCSVCGAVLTTVLVVDPKAGTSRIRKDHYADRIHESSDSRESSSNRDDRELTPA